MELSEARERLFNIALKYAIQLSVKDIEALTYGAEALKTIEDMGKFNAPCFDRVPFIITDAITKGETEHDTQ